MNSTGFIVGVSNRLHYDLYSDNHDEILDDNLVTILTTGIPNILSVGTDDRVKLSSFWIILSKLLYLYKEKLRVNILIKNNDLRKLKYLEKLPPSMLSTSNSVAEFIDIINQTETELFNFNLLVNPYKFKELQKEQWSSGVSESVSIVQSLFEKAMTFNMVWSDDAKTLREMCSYIDTEFKLRIISVGNTTSIKNAISNDLWDKVTDEVFNTVQSNVIKAYYYNKNTDKIGHIRMLDPTYIVKSTSFPTHCEQQDSEDTGFSGLVGN